MIILRALGVLLGVVVAAAGGVVLWLSGQLSASPVAAAQVVLAGPRVTDLDLPAGDRVQHLQALTDGAPAGIGSTVDVQVLRSPVELTRLVGDDRWPVAGWVLVGVGLVLVAVLVLVRRRRRPAAGVAVLALTLVLTGCSWTGDDVDRAAYREARAELAAAFPAVGDQVPIGALDPADELGTAVTGPDDAADVVLQLAGLPADDTASRVAARYAAGQLADRAVLCRADDADPAVFAGLLSLFTPGVQEALAPRLPTTMLRSAACPALGQAVTIRSATATTSDRIPDASGPGRLVRLTVVGGYEITAADGRTLPWSVGVEVLIGILDDPTAGAYVASGGLGEGAGQGQTLFTPPATGDAWPAEAWPDGPWLRSELAEPDAADPDAAAAVVQATADLVGTPAVTTALDRSWSGDGEDGGTQGSGTLVPASGAALLSLTDVTDGTAREVRVLDRSVQYGSRDDGWSTYDTSVPPSLGEGPTTDNPYAVLDWLRSLSAAAPTDCPDDWTATTCALVTVPTTAALVPGTPGYREGVVAARYGAAERTFLTGVTDGRLTQVRVDDSEVTATGGTVRITSTWTFGAPTDPVEVARPPLG